MSEFEWDEGNVDHVMHRYSPGEIESVFSDPHAQAIPAYATDRELRYGIVGTSNRGQVIAVFFTFRGPAIRVVTARPARRNERREYGI